MTFELSAEALRARDQARALAEAIRPQASAIDRTAAIPAELARELATLGSTDPMATVVMVEEIASACAAAATGLLAGKAGKALGLTGLRGAFGPEDSPRTQLALAAVALGVGRAALEAALEGVRQPAASDVERPQWVVADVATDLDAARLLTYKAAGTMKRADVALARLQASAAAERAVDVAVRVVGSTALTTDSVIERLTRDVRVLSVLLGTEEDHRAVAAEALLP